ncbi:smalltalk protein [Segatella copri]|jgi:hypothetical protein|nr:smalltalk protein [Segatella copri]MBM0145487.1 smalltalk protein [Segatella copri]WOZ83231.1 smalltalk protein [Segatella copri]
MSKENWKLVLKVLISLLTAIGATLGVTSCM